MCEEKRLAKFDRPPICHVMKYALLTCLLSPLFLSITVSDTTISTDLNEIIVESNLIVYAKAIDGCQVSEDGITKQYIHFDVTQTFRGTTESLLSVNTDAIYDGDIPHQLIESNSFHTGQHYLLFLQQNDSALSLLVNHTLVEIAGDEEESYFSNSRIHTTDSDGQLYRKGAMLNSIESFLYNETEILDSEILATNSF